MKRRRIFRVYRPRRRGPRGASIPYGRWYVELVDATGKIRRLAGFSDRPLTVALARTVERLVELRIERREPSGEAARAVEALPTSIRERLESWNILDAPAAAAAQPLADLIGRWYAVLLARGNVRAHAELSRSLALRTFTEARATYFSEIRLEAVENALAERRKQGASVATSNRAAQAVKGFCRWATENGLAPADPLVSLKLGNERADPKRVRRALTGEEMQNLIATTETEPTRYGMSGPARAIAYRVLLETGLRRNEMRTLRVADFDLDARTVTVQAAYSKRRRADVLPLRPATARALAGFLGGLGALERPFPLPARTADMLALDLEAAEIPIETEAGVVDLHALRHSFISALARGGVHPAEAQKLARHSTIALTLDRYTHVHAADAARALDVLPDLDAPAPLRATGTAGDVPEGVAGAATESHSGVARNVAFSGSSECRPMPSEGMAERAGFEPADPWCGVTRLAI